MNAIHMFCMENAELSILAFGVSEEYCGHIEEELTINSLNRVSEKEMHNIVERLLSHKDLASSNRTLSMLEEERIKFQFFASMASEIQFEYTIVPCMITLSDWGAEKLGISRSIVNPEKNEELLSVIRLEDLQRLDETLRNTTPSSPIVEFEAELTVNGEKRFSRIICRALCQLWANNDTMEPPEDCRFGGRTEELTRLRKLASIDPLTNC